MSPNLGFGSADMNASVSVDYEVVADAFPTFSFVPAVNVGNCIVATFGGQNNE